MNIIPKALATAALILTANLTAAPQLSFSGNSKPVITEKPEASTGLKEVYVVRDASGVRVSYTASSAASDITWKRFSSLGGGFAEEIPFTREGAVTSVSLTNEDMGYIVEEDGRQNCFYIVNYSNHECSLEALDISPESDCQNTLLILHGNADRINYYTVSGAARQLSRGLQLEYNTLEYNADNLSYQPVQATEEIQYVSSQIHCQAPLRDTEFHLSGDRFQRQWGELQQVVSPMFPTNAIAATTTASQEERDAENEQKPTGDEASLGGSAPAIITFSAATTDAVVFREWQFARDDQFDLIDLRVNEDEVTHTFTDYGTTYVRFVCGNAAGSCDYTSDTYTVYIGESRLECPNAFSPNDDGGNDEWRVSYKSIVSFDCHIYNRWGLEMAHLSDPSQGWDGRYNGKKVQPGVYYYVIKAEGADGKHYKKSGDINIVGYSQRTGASSSTPSEP